MKDQRLDYRNKKEKIPPPPPSTTQLTPAPSPSQSPIKYLEIYRQGKNRLDKRLTTHVSAAVRLRMCVLIRLLPTYVFVAYKDKFLRPISLVLRPIRHTWGSYRYQTVLVSNVPPSLETEVVFF
jgi:hypothetical protein